VEDALELHDTLRTYRLFAGSYDVVFGPIFHPGRKAAVEVANDRPHQRILEVGVGTGLSLPHFRKDARVTGIDVSKEMLAKARRRVERDGLRQVEALQEMDAEANPARFVAEMRRVCKPGGTIVIVNHFTSANPAMRWLERRLAPLAGKIGFHADFPLDEFLKAGRLRVRETRPSNMFGYWKLLRCVNEK
jgi:phosphatidylethanolamine/phosphatidyl-N-methylethanolamine N-methyltransferase